VRYSSNRIKAAAALLTTLLVLAGCGSGSATTGTGATGAESAAGAVSGGNLTWGIETLPLTLNPQVNGQNKAKLLVRNQFDSLVSRGEGGSFEPWLATSWTVSTDGRVYTLQLRDDVTFHDGTRFDAAAVKANFDKLLEPAYSPSVAAINLGQLASTVVKGPHTVVFTLKRPVASFLDFLSSPNSGIISPASLKSAANLTAGGVDVVGTGPFILTKVVAGQEIDYKKNPDYKWPPAGAKHRGPAYLDTVTYRILPEAAVRTGALTSKQVDVIEGVPSSDIDIFAKDSSYTFANSLNSGAPYGLYFNLSKSPTSDVRVRRAFVDAVDLDAVLKSVYFGHATRAWTPVSSTSPFYAKAVENTYGNKPDEANKLLDEAGWTARDTDGYRTKNGQRLTLRLTAASPYIRDRRDVLLQAVSANVKQTAGIDFKVTIADVGTATKASSTNAYEVFDNSRGDSDAGDALALIWGRGAPINYSKANDPKLTTWLGAGSTALTQTARVKPYQSLQTWAIDQAVELPLYVPADQIATTADVHGAGFQPVSGVPDGAYDIWKAK
jgi:peptide/nickel transport system substrate-binding protein